MKKLAYSSARKETPKKKKGFFQRKKPFIATVAAITISALSYYYCSRNFPFWEAGIYSYSERSGMVSHWEKDGTLQTAKAIASLSGYLNMSNRKFISALEDSNFIIFPFRSAEMIGQYDASTGNIKLYPSACRTIVLHEVLHKAFDHIKNKEEVKKRLLKLHKITQIPYDKKIELFGQDVTDFLGTLILATGGFEWTLSSKSKERFEENIASEIYASLPTVEGLGIPKGLEYIYSDIVNNSVIEQTSVPIDLNNIEKIYDGRM
ncbi:hypothetical protein KAW38_02705 [Candidatus Micrarchaeota archaeon]|nr:hypothetical protein [Candidatus Micrarchaeota archaeon]